MNWKPWSGMKKAIAKWTGNSAKTEDVGQKTANSTTATGGRITRRVLRRMSERCRPTRATAWRMPKGPAWLRRAAISARFWGKIEARRPLEVRPYSGRKCPRCKLRTTAHQRKRALTANAPKKQAAA